MNFAQILNKYREIAYSERDKGDRFERLMQAYLYTDPRYAHLTKVWLWSEFPYRADFGSHDVGIDLVALTAEGEYWAIQCKCYQETNRITKENVDTFLSTSGRSFLDSEAKRQKFSNRLWISTTNNWSEKANETLRNQDPAVTRLNLSDLQEAPVKWGKIDEGIFGEKARTAKKDLRLHQRQALSSAVDYFKHSDRGKLIMACGTGKTFTSLRIAEAQSGKNGVVLFLVPSIALLGQTLREWTADADESINPIAVCSDSEITKEKKKNEDAETYSTIDLAIPASTNVDSILKQFELFELTDKQGLTVVFSTYQSIDVISKTQRRLESIGSRYAKFDLIICDEAHRTTGVTLANSDESSFVKVHKNDFINADKRLYMTATPRLYGEDSKQKAQESSAEICSMDDEKLYGREIYRIGFGMAVEQGLLSDYKVMILTLSESDVTPEVQQALANTEQEIASMDDVSKLIGCINAMSKQIIGETGAVNVNDPNPMRRAVAFVPNIKTSRKITNTFNEIGDTYYDSVPELKQETLVNLRSKHIDGSMSATERDQLMSWLKEEPEDSHEARVLTNVRCLSEGVDVPSLDAVMFLSARNSQVDVVQSVGRVMRRSPGKEYGYIIIPIVIPNDVKPEDALNDNARYKVVWTVLNALRAHDDRFNATINKIELNKNKPKQILIGRPDPDGDGDPFNDPEHTKKSLAGANQVALHFNELQTAIYAKMVQKVGERAYWDQWAKDIAGIAERHIKRITKIVDEDDMAHMAFREFVRGLRRNLNPSITEAQAIEMLSQHMITKPVFEALFEGYSFVQNNVVSQSMQKALDAIEHKAIDEEEAQLLESFYQSVRRRAAGVDNAEGKQKIIVELYDRFFKTGFPKLVEQLGIVYTPIEIVDFIIRSVNDVLRKEFGRSLSDENVNILDPFTGTGTFITRLLQSGVIKREDLERKYRHEIFANEIVLLAYYIAAVNIESTYHDLLQKDEYESFEGIVLTDTFQLSEEDDNTKLFSEALAENSERLQRQKNTPLRVIIGNPPYSIGQKSANDDAQNQKYPKLDAQITRTYARASSAGLNKSLYDSYVKAFRWATDRLGSEGGVVGFISNGSWLDGSSQDGMRKILEKDFTSIYAFNLRGRAVGNSGEHRKKEAENVFGAGTRTLVSITLLVKDPSRNTGKTNIYYHDIGDYLQREEKLKIIDDFGTVENMDWEEITPDTNGDWINRRNTAFDSFLALTPAKKLNKDTQSFFVTNAIGVSTNRDPWVYNFSKQSLLDNMRKTIEFYNSQSGTRVDNDSNKISWSVNLKKDAAKGKKHSLKQSSVIVSSYRPFTKLFLYSDRPFIERPGTSFSFLPDSKVLNRIICISPSLNDGVAVLMTDHIANLHFNGDSQCFPLYYYEEIKDETPSLFGENADKHVRRDGLSDFILQRAQTQYRSKDITKEDIFYYVYGLLHNRDYRQTFANDLKKSSPRLPLTEEISDFWAFSKAGRKLADLHINYEEVPPYQGIKVTGTQYNNYVVEKLKFISKTQRDTIIYNPQIKIENIPDKAYEYLVNGRSAIEWIMDRYQSKKDPASNILNDPNDWAKEVGNPRYVLDLLLSIINVSVQTVDIVNSLPKLTFETEKNE